MSYLYLESGFADEAAQLLRQALEREPSKLTVAKALAAVEVHREKESESEQTLLRAAANHREFLVNLGSALLDTGMPNLDGTWEFPIGAIELRVSGRDVSGFGEKHIEVPNLARLFGLGSLSGAAIDTAKRSEEHTV